MGNQLHNIRIFPEDIVYIPKREDSRVTVIGEVRNPRVVNWKTGTTFLDVISYCGGLADDYWSKALIIRKPKSAKAQPVQIYKIDVDDVIAGRKPNFMLAAGDILYIPKDALGEYNVFIKKLLPTAQLINLLMNPPAYWFGNK
ncbi:MAG: SLBB domain-containing protein, partial [Opitutales bacterium]|nr:SLBB domain-containing protein [Opitutales bacterium]